MVILAMLYLPGRTRIQAPEALEVLVDAALRQAPLYCDFVNRHASRLPPGKWSWIPAWLQSYAAKRLFKLDSDRLKAFSTLQAMGTNAWPAIPALLAALDSKDPAVRRLAVHALIVVEAYKAPAIDRLKSMLAGKTRPAQTLVDLLAGHSFQPGTPFLEKMGGHVFEVAAGFYGFEGDGLGQGDDAEHLFEVAEGRDLRRDSPALRFALTALAACGRGARTAIPLLQRLAASQNADPVPRAMAITALGEIDHGIRNQTVPLLWRLLRDSGEWPRVRGAAAASLARLAPNDTDIPILLRHALRADAGAVRAGAAEGLWRLRAPAGELLPVLIAALDQKLVSVRCASLRVLGEMGGAARAAKPAVEARLQDESKLVRRQAALALQRIGSE
jgi:HEAT repeat protein